MRVGSLRNKFMLGAIAICIVLAIAYMAAVSLVVRQQNLNQSHESLTRAYSIVEDGLDRRKADLLEASRTLAEQKNLGSTIWYLTQYSKSNLDHGTLVYTFQHLAQETMRIGLVARAGKVAIYNSAGKLISFTLLNGRSIAVGYVDRSSAPIFHVVNVQAGEGINWDDSRSARALPGMSELSNQARPINAIQYAVIDGAISLESHVPIVGEAFDSTTGKPERKQLGFVVMTQPIGLHFAEQYSKLTNFDINIFAASGQAAGTLKSYQTPDWGKKGTHGITFNEISAGRNGYYQCMLPLYNGNVLEGSIAILESSELIRNNTLEMIKILWLLASASVLFTLPLSWYFATSISQPIEILTRIIRALATGNDYLKNKGVAQLLKGRTRKDELGELTGSFIAMNDAIEQKISQINELNATLESRIQERTTELAAKERESRTLIENSPDSISRYDMNCRRIYVNPAFAEMTVGGRPSLLGKRPSEYPGGQEMELYEQKIREVFETGENAQFELSWHDKNGRETCSHIRLTAEYDASGKITTVIGIGRDITERKEFEKLVWMQANFDDLTRLPNRQMFHDRLEHEAKLSNRSGNPMALLLVDLDHFKEVNDTLGHDKGDQLLIEAARRISVCVRDSDTVARLGGDEFTIILPELADVAGIERIAQEILSTLADPFQIESENIHISASIGISLYPNDTKDLDVLFKNADQAMYAAKSEGKNRFSYFTPVLQENAQMRLFIANELRNALASDQFRVCYQPIVELPSRKIKKAEALLRWMHPSRGMVSPSEFIAIAEESRMIVSIGDWVFREVVHQAKIWSDIPGQFIQISINKSPLQITQEGKISWLDYLDQEGLDPRHISVEITESMLLNPSKEVNEKLLKFRDSGIQLAIDDFGTGYSSLSYLKAFDIDIIKIDQSYISHIDINENDLVICQAIIAMAHKLGLKVVAEGVETVAQHEILVEAGCDFGQGFLYSHPLPPDEFEKLLASRT